MAKKYLNLFRDSAETAYATGQLPLMGLAALNKGVKFNAVTPAAGDTSNTIQYVIQRMKRAKAGAAPAKTGKAATDAVALLDTAQKVDWESVNVMAGAKRSLVFNVSPFEEIDPLEDASAFNSTISNMTENRMFEAEELATAKVYGAGTLSATKLVVDGTKDIEVVKALQDAVSNIELLVDDFKAYSQGVAVIVHPTVAKAFSRVQGQGYTTGTNTFPEGLGKGFRYDGIDYFVSPILNTIAGKAATEVAGAIVMDMEAYANSGLETSVKEFDQELADERFVGHTYHELDAVIDAARIATFEMTLPKGAKASAKVSA